MRKEEEEEGIFRQKGFQRSNDDLILIFKDAKNGSNVISTLFNVQLEASTPMSDNMTEQLCQRCCRCGENVIRFKNLKALSFIV